MPNESHTCARCNYAGYSPSGAVMLSRGEVECPVCEGFDTPHNPHQEQQGCGCVATDPSGHSCGHPCIDCTGGVIECNHAGSEA